MMGTDGRHAAESTWLLKTKKGGSGSGLYGFGKRGQKSMFVCSVWWVGGIWACVLRLDEICG